MFRVLCQQFKLDVAFSSSSPVLQQIKLQNIVDSRWNGRNYRRYVIIYEERSIAIVAKF